MRFLGGSVAALILSLMGLAHAQKAEADAAFQRAKDLMARGETAKACAEFETSMRLEPQRGTLYNLALCHEKAGRIASAWSEFKELAASDPNAARAKDSARRAAALAKKLTRMRIVITEPVDGLVVKRGDLDVTALAGEPVPVDPDRYTFVVTAPGKKPATVEADLTKPGATIAVTIPALAAALESRDGGDRSDGGNRGDRGNGGSSNPATIALDPFALSRALRPLALPAKVVELTAAARFERPVDRDLGIDSVVSARAGFGPVEASADVAIHTRYAVANNRPTLVRSAAIAARYVISPMMTTGVSYRRYHPLGGRRDLGSDFRITFARKYLVSPKVALLGAGGVGYDFRDSDTMDSNTAGSTHFGVDGTGIVQLTPTARVTLEAGLQFQLNLTGDVYRDRVLFSLSAGAYVSMSTHMDAFAVMNVPGTDESGETRYLIGLNRRLP